SSQVGSTSIEPEHILAGLMRDHTGLVRGVLKDAGITPADIRADLAQAAISGPKLSTAVEIPFSPPVKRILQFAATEADTMNHNYVGSEHLLLALLGEEKTVAWDILTRRGLNLAQARSKVFEQIARNPQGVDGTTPYRGYATMQAANRIRDIRLTL